MIVRESFLLLPQGGLGAEIVWPWTAAQMFLNFLELGTRMQCSIVTLCNSFFPFSLSAANFPTGHDTSILNSVCFIKLDTSTVSACTL